MAIRTDSVDELIGLCNRFMASHVYLSTQQTKEPDQNDDSNYIPNPIVYNVRGCPPKRLKGAVEIAKNKRPLKEITNVNQRIEQDLPNNSELSAAGVVHGRG